MFVSEVISTLFIAFSDTNIVQKSDLLRKSTEASDFPCPALSEARFLQVVATVHPYTTSAAEIRAVYRECVNVHRELGNVGTMLRMNVEEFAVAVWHLSRLRYPIPDDHFQAYIQSFLIPYCLKLGLLPSDPVWCSAFSHWRALTANYVSATIQTRLWHSVSDLGRSTKFACKFTSCSCGKRPRSSTIASGVTLCRFHRFVRLCFPDRVAELSLSSISAVFNTVCESASSELRSLACVSDVLDGARCLSERGLLTALAFLCDVMSNLPSICLEAECLKECPELFARCVVTRCLEVWLKRTSRITAP
jgi:hypothetical protein